jgi:hypothetical protein
MCPQLMRPDASTVIETERGYAFETDPHPNPSPCAQGEGLTVGMAVAPLAVPSASMVSR